MHDTIRQRLNTPRFEGDFARFLDSMTRVNLAHVMMLRDVGLMNDEMDKELLHAITTVRSEALNRIEGSHTEDFYFAFEAAVLDITGPEGGDLHIGRSRNDITACLAAMELRDQTNEALSSVLALLGSMVALAGRHVQTVMPGYTHLRAAQPTTLGHYLMGVALALQRDVERLQLVYHHLSNCPMGAAAFAGTSHAIDRRNVALALGFLGPTPHSLDAVASRDVHLQFIATAVGLSSTLSRFVQDLYVWSTPEFGFVLLGDDATSTSSIMPQKRNPTVLERCRAKAGNVLAAMVGAATALKGTGFMHSQDSSVDATAPTWVAASETIDLVEVLRIVIETLDVDCEAMAERSRSGFLTSTEIADHLVRAHDIPFRTAHTIVRGAVRRLGHDTQDPDAWRTAVAESAAREGTSIPPIDSATLNELIDPMNSVARRISSGSPSPTEVRRIVEEAAYWVESRRKEVWAERSRLRTAEQALEERVAREA